MSPKIEILVVPGSPFCIKVASAMEYKSLDYSFVPVHPAKLKKETPPPHLVPVMRYGNQTIPDSQAILKYIDNHHNNTTLPLYPKVTGGAADQWSTVEELEQFAHDKLTFLYYYFGGISDFGKRNVTVPFVRSILPTPLVTILPFIPTLGAKAAAGQLRKRVVPILGDDVIASEDAARAFLYACLRKLEASFKTSDQKFLFATEGPTAADFGVFAALKRLLHPLPDVAKGISGGYPDALKDTGNVPRLKKFFDLMNRRYYEGRVDWSTAKI